MPGKQCDTAYSRNSSKLYSQENTCVGDFLIELHLELQLKIKQPFADVLQNGCSLKFCSIHRKTSVLESAALLKGASNAGVFQ